MREPAQLETVEPQSVPVHVQNDEHTVKGKVRGEFSCLSRRDIHLRVVLVL